MFRFILFMYSFCLLAVTSFSQTTRQSDVFNEFVKNRAGSIIQSWAHLTCTAVSYSYEYNNHTYHLGLTYNTSEGRSFTCKYVLDFTNTGKLLSFNHTCNEFWGACFDGCEIGKYILKECLKDKSNEDAIRALGKAIEYCTCEDGCYLRLYTAWVSEGYYNRY